MTNNALVPSLTDGFLNYDCASIVLDNCDIYALAKCQLVNKQWKRVRQQYIAEVGLHKHFPEKHKHLMATETAGKIIQPYEKWNVFNECAYQKALRDNWLEQRPRSHSIITCNQFTSITKFIVWEENNALWWRWTGYQEYPHKPPHINHKPNFKPKFRVISFI
ncbi:hypothetical protein BDW74DRAFT_178059 [Aspergillus multicolor]|uniref:uncharacterized protein n=1 Tax=Aspergillus multicolor TaxID=41759 RepID=UPI003CCCDAB3